MRVPHSRPPCVASGAPVLLDRALARIFAAIVPERGCVPVTGPLLGTTSCNFLTNQCGRAVRGGIRRTARYGEWKPQGTYMITVLRGPDARISEKSGNAGYWASRPAGLPPISRKRKENCLSAWILYLTATAGAGEHVDFTQMRYDNRQSRNS